MSRVHDPDFLDEVITERTEANPEFPAMLAAASEARRLVQALVSRREKLGLTQEAVAIRMGTSQPAVARLESGGADPRLSTVGRYAAALGTRLSLP